ncbi:MAG: pyridoxamine 5'-phosphate oxidase family protein [Chitinivibrionales bacterium]
MNKLEVLGMLREIIDDARTAVLATVDGNGAPHTRWVTPALLDSCPGSIYMITSPHFTKVNHVENNPLVEWLFQTRSLTKIVNVQGRIMVRTNTALRSEVLEELAPALRTFWKVNTDKHELVVLETVISEASVFLPTDGIKEKVSFATEKDHG